MSEIDLGKLTRKEFRQRIESGQLKLCILPVAATEQHLEHLAMEHDWRSVIAVATQIARNLTPHVLVAEAVQVGISEHHMTHSGTLTLRPGTFLAIVNDLLRSLVQAGFRRILVLNGHGGNVAPCNAVWEQFVREFQVQLHFMSYWDVLTKADAEELLRSGSRLPEDLPGHAQEFETSLGLALFPQNVRSQLLSESPDPHCRLADAQAGQQLFDRIITRLTRFTDEMLNDKIAWQVPDFHP